MTDFKPDLYTKFYCNDCKKIFLMSGSTPVTKIECTHCKCKNWTYEKDSTRPKKQKPF